MSRSVSDFNSPIPMGSPSSSRNSSHPSSAGASPPNLPPSSISRLLNRVRRHPAAPKQAQPASCSARRVCGGYFRHAFSPSPPRSRARAQFPCSRPPPREASPHFLPALTALRPSRLLPFSDPTLAAEARWRQTQPCCIATASPLFRFVLLPASSVSLRRAGRSGAVNNSAHSEGPCWPFPLKRRSRARRFAFSGDSAS